MAELFVLAFILLAMSALDWAARFVGGGEQEMKNRQAVHERRVAAQQRPQAAKPKK